MCVLKRTLLLLFLGSFTSNGNLLHPSNNHAFQSLTIQNNVPIDSSIVRQSNASHVGTSSTGSSNSSNTDINYERNIHGNASTFDIQEPLKNLSLFGETKNSSSRGNVNSEILLKPSGGVSSMRSQTQNSSIFAGNLAKMIQDIYDKIATYMTTFQGNGQPVANSVGYIHSMGHAINPDKVTSEDTTNGNNGNVNALYQKLINLCQQQCRYWAKPNGKMCAYCGRIKRHIFTGPDLAQAAVHRHISGRGQDFCGLCVPPRRHGREYDQTYLDQC